MNAPTLNGSIGDQKLEPKQLNGKIFPAMGSIVTTAPLGELARQINPQDLAVYDCRFVLDYYLLTGDEWLNQKPDQVQSQSLST